MLFDLNFIMAAKVWCFCERAAAFWDSYFTTSRNSSCRCLDYGAETVGDFYLSV